VSEITGKTGDQKFNVTITNADGSTTEHINVSAISADRLSSAFIYSAGSGSASKVQVSRSK
jgi:hypothetical protein